MGRKAMKPGEKFEIRMRLDGETYSRLQAAAEDQGNPVAAFIRALVKKELKRIDKENAE